MNVTKSGVFSTGCLALHGRSNCKIHSTRQAALTPVARTLSDRTLMPYLVVLSIQQHSLSADELPMSRSVRRRFLFSFLFGHFAALRVFFRCAPMPLLPIKVSSRHPIFMRGVTAVGTADDYFLRGRVVTEVAGPVAFGSVLGAIAGAHILLVVSN